MTPGDCTGFRVQGLGFRVSGDPLEVVTLYAFAILATRLLGLARRQPPAPENLGLGFRV